MLSLLLKSFTLKVERMLISKNIAVKDIITFNCPYSHKRSNNHQCKLSLSFAFNNTYTSLLSFSLILEKSPNSFLFRRLSYCLNGLKQTKVIFLIFEFQSSVYLADTRILFCSIIALLAHSFQVFPAHKSS